MIILIITVVYDLMAMYIGYKLLKWEGVFFVLWLLFHFNHLEK